MLRLATLDTRWWPLPMPSLALNGMRHGHDEFPRGNRLPDPTF
jgi:hypothetical protein